MGASVGNAIGQEWSRIRKAFNSHFNSTSVNNSVEYLVDETQKFVYNINRESNNNEPTEADLESIGLVDITLKLLCMITWGKDFSDENFKYLKSLNGLHLQTIQAMNNPWTRLPFYRFLPTRTNAVIQDFLFKWNAFNDSFVNKYKTGNQKRDDQFYIISMGIESRDIEMSYDEFYQTVYENTFFNNDINYISVKTAIVTIAHMTEIQNKCYKEIEQVLVNKSEKLTLLKLENLKYVDNVILEIARMKPQLLVSFAERISKDTEIGGYQIPKNTLVCVDAYSLNHNPAIWPEPFVFKPERFDNPQNDNNFHRFGMGPRRCLGFRYAHIMLKIIIVSILRTFKIEIIGDDLYSHESPLVFLKSSEHTKILFTPRINN